VAARGAVVDGVGVTVEEPPPPPHAVKSKAHSKKAGAKAKREEKYFFIIFDSRLFKRLYFISKFIINFNTKI
jgi:hypothetical protein